jgi:hypothetical protein
VYLWFDAPLSLACAGTVYKALDWFDNNLNPKLRKEIADWFANRSPQLPGDIFTTLIDRIFGRRVLSARFLLTSCAAGLVAFSFVLLIYNRWNDFPADFLDVVPVYVLNALVSVGPTVTIYLGSVIIHGANVQGLSQAWKAVTSFYRHDSSPIPFLSASGTAYGLLYYPIFFTSIWIWLYLFSSVLMKFIGINVAVRNFLARCLDVEAHPLRSAGLVLAAFTFLMVLISSPFIFRAGKS